MVEDFEKSVVQSQAIAQSGVLFAVRMQEKAILDNLVSLYRAKKLEDRDAMIGIATISQMRSLVGKMERSLTQGFEVTQQLIEGE